MNRNWLLAHWRRMAMQAVLCGVLAVTVALAALTVHQKRLALRLPLTSDPTHVGRLYAFVPRGWPTISSEETPAGDTLSLEELLPDGSSGRRLSIQRLRTAGLLSPLEQLLRTPYLRDSELIHDGASPATPPHVQRLDVAGWPGVMVSRTITSFGGRRTQRQILACSVLPPAQAVVIRLDDPREPDAADEELIRQMAENVSVREGSIPLVHPETGGTVELGGGVFAPVPDHFFKLPADVNRTSRDLMADGYHGKWTAIELIPCLWLPGDDERTFLSLLTARDRDWRSGPVKTLGDGIWQVDRLDDAHPFPSRAYCLTDGGQQAILAIMHGGFHEDQLFDSAWQAISANIRFTTPKDLPTLLRNGREQVERLVENGADQFITPQAGRQDWSLWDQAENTDKQFWMQLDWGPKVFATSRPAAPPASAAETGAEAAVSWEGSRVTRPDRPLAASSASLLRLYDTESSDEIHQTWTGTTDFTQYKLFVDQVVSEHGKMSHSTATQRWELRDGQLRNLLSGDDPRPVPKQYVPGGWLPLVLGKLSDKPMVLRTESFIGCEGASPPELLTLHVSHVTGTPMRCVTVTINGTGKITRWWFDLDGTLRYIDFAGGLRAQRNDAGAAQRR